MSAAFSFAIGAGGFTKLAKPMRNAPLSNIAICSTAAIPRSNFHGGVSAAWPRLALRRRRRRAGLYAACTDGGDVGNSPPSAVFVRDREKERAQPATVTP